MGSHQVLIFASISQLQAAYHLGRVDLIVKKQSKSQVVKKNLKGYFTGPISFRKNIQFRNKIEELSRCFKKLITMYQKKTWTDQEDNIIRSVVKQMGDRPRWKSVAQSLNQLITNAESSNKRTPKQCRQRWHNKLDPQILDKQWDQDQINQLFYLHNQYGNKWSLIATMMNGRTDNCVKNKFYSALRKGMRKINKYIVNLKRKLAQNKNICIKQFKDVVLTKLIAVADKKYEDKLQIKENSISKTQKLSQLIKHALVKVSKNEDDYIGHVQNGIPDDTYDLEEDLFKNIQEFCRNCKRKKGKRKSDDDADLNEDVSEMVQESQQVQSKQNKIQKKQKPESFQKFSDILPFHQTKNKISRETIFEEQKLCLKQAQSTKEDFILGLKSQKDNIFELQTLTNFTKVMTEQTIEQVKDKNESKLSKMQTKQIQTIESFCNEIIYEPPGFSFFQNIRSVQFQRTDHNGKLMKDFKPQQIFKQINSAHHLQTSHNQLSLSSSNQFGMIQKSQSFLNLYRSMEGIHDPNQVMYVSSSLSSGSNKQQQKFVEFFHSKSEKKDDIQASQVFAQSFNFNDSLQLDDLFKRMSQNKN